MREIKFRFWDFKEMIYWDKINKEHCYYYLANLRNERSYIIPMQYTGLLDMNGKEIYEGDILGKYGQDHPCGEYISFVEWKSDKGEWYLNKTWISGQRNLWRWCCRMEVIGNIYENPELLQ